MEERLEMERCKTWKTSGITRKIDNLVLKVDTIIIVKRRVKRMDLRPI